MLFWIAIVCALGTAVCNGIAAILQKVSTDKQHKATSAHPALLYKLAKDKHFLAGSFFDTVAWLLTLLAVQILPLFVVQPITALSVVVVILIEYFVMRRAIAKRSGIAIAVIVAGLLLLATSASAEQSAPASTAVRLGVMFAPLVLAAGGAWAAKRDSDTATVTLAAISGMAFGGTAIVGRMMHFSAPLPELLLNPLWLAMIAYGLVGILLFSIALQRHHASIVNAAMISFETVAPVIVGTVLLGDRPEHGAWLTVVIGIAMAMLGTAFISVTETQTEADAAAVVTEAAPVTLKVEQ